MQAASYGKKNGIWYAAPGGQGWSKATSRKASIVETDAPPPGGGTIKPSSGRVIRIINNMDHTVQVSIYTRIYSFNSFAFIYFFHKVAYSVPQGTVLGPILLFYKIN